MEKKENKQNASEKSDKYIVDIISAGLEKNSERVEYIALTFARYLQKEQPEVANKIKQLISTYSTTNSVFKGTQGIPAPVDSDTHLDMVTVLSPSADNAPLPILNPLTADRVKNFIEERNNIKLLLDKNLKPSTALLLIGPSGTGKTMLAHYIAGELDKDLVVLDLSSSISSLMGKTGHNLKRVLQYAKQTSSILLLDEFDAIAKKRDDNTDLGEIKRVVNVLLMELENWPASSVVIATSNHPELLDRAIWRRFDHVIEVSLPEEDQRFFLLKQELSNVFKEEDVLSLLQPMAGLLNNKSAADICKFSNNIKRRIVLKKEEPIAAAFHELELYINDKIIRGKFCALAKEKLGDSITVRELSKITGLSTTAVQHHITKAKKNDKQKS